MGVLPPWYLVYSIGYHLIASRYLRVTTGFAFPQGDTFESQHFDLVIIINKALNEILRANWKGNPTGHIVCIFADSVYKA